MKRQKSIGNKGFSLVELIIVVAIMAILIGVMAPQLMKYVDRARVSKDTQAVDAVHTAVVTAMLDPMVTDAPASKTFASLADLYSYADATTGTTQFADAVKEIANTSTATDIEGAGFVSKAYKGQTIQIKIENSKVTCTVTTIDTNVAPTLVID